MKKVILVAAIAIAAGFSSKVSAQLTNTAEANATATIIKAIEIEKTKDLNFGAMSVKGSDGTCKISTANTRTKTGGVNISLTGAAVEQSAAEYTITGGNDATFAVTLPSTVNVKKGAGGTATTEMTIGSFKASVNNAADIVDGGTGTLSATGTATMKVGAELSVIATQEEGNYTGTFNVTVQYN